MRRPSIDGRGHGALRDRRQLSSFALATFSLALICSLAAAGDASAQLVDEDGDGFAVAKVGALLDSNGIAFDEASDKAYVASTYGGITVADMNTGRYLRTLDISRSAVTPNGVGFAGGKLYVGTLHDVVVVDPDDGSVTSRVSRPFFAGSIESEFAVSPDGHRVYAAAGCSTVLLVIDAATESEEAIIPVGPNCNRIALSPDGHTAYLTNKEAGLLWAVDLDARTVIEAVPIASRTILDFPCDVDVSPTSGNVYVSWVGSDYDARVTEFTSGLSQLRTFETGRFSTGLDVSPDGRFALLGAGLVLDVAEGLFVGDLPLPQNGISEVAFRSDSNAAVVTHDAERAVQIASGFSPPLRASGSTRMGGRLEFTIELPAAAGSEFQLVASNTTEDGFPACTGIVFPLDLDPLFQLTRSGGGTFATWSGRLDGGGRGRASITLTRDLPIRGAGFPISIAFATFEGGRGRFDVARVSNTITAWVKP